MNIQELKTQVEELINDKETKEVLLNEMSSQIAEANSRISALFISISGLIIFPRCGGIPLKPAKCAPRTRLNKIVSALSSAVWPVAIFV